MLKTLKIENFRGFKSFELQQLGRVNLLVGVNNSGKTSILEAIQMLYSQASIVPFDRIMMERGEYFLSYVNSNNVEQELDVCHLFYGREIKEDGKFLISGINDYIQQKLVVEITSGSISIEDISGGNSEADVMSNELARFGLSVKWTHGNSQERHYQRPLSPHGGLSHTYASDWSIINQKSTKKTQLITSSSSLTIEMMTKLFENVVLTPEEKLVYEALQTIEPRIERIASVSSSSRRYIYPGSRGGFVVRLSDSEQRVPIGSLGDGIWRMLGLALAIVSVKGGVLLVDEIDTGLHFTTLSDMWKLIWETAKKLDVQVFATTHNSDCWTSLATIASQEDAA
ncbi:MAG: AAA family ATPase, partial [Symploca sp. SIO1B1]|nr:AAA family ATPase [Symploca sp. SIO1B1]